MEGPHNATEYHSLMLDTDYLVCVMAPDSPLARHAMVTLAELKNERMILRLPASATRVLFESTLNSINDSIDNFNIALEVDNIATIKDLIRKGLGVSILPRKRLYGRVEQGQNRRIAHREPEHGAGDARGLQQRF